ncbi:hypothetical protein ABIE91_009288 [Bradyrhizobium elkanii]
MRSDDQLAQQRRDRQCAAAVGQVGGTGLDEDEKDPRIGGCDIGVVGAAGKPDAAVRGHHPQPVRNAAHHAAAERNDELSLPVRVLGRLDLVFGDVEAHGDGRRRDVIRI